MIQAPPQIEFIGLSATISNYQQLADWMASHRGEMGVVVVHERPVELKLWLGMENRFHPLFDEHGQVMRRTWNLAQDELAADHRFQRQAAAGAKGPPWKRNIDSNNMLHIIGELQRQQMLPAIYFIFSRRGCEEALRRCAMHKLDLTSVDEKSRIEARVRQKLDEVADSDEAALYLNLLRTESITTGIAAHHAGLLPFLKEVVEELFQDGLLKVVFATETLALGIHMPARAVVISTFTKFDGRGFPPLSSGELTQLMGRAGRRGIDRIGHGVILKDPEVDIGVIYEAALGEEMVVESKFAPTYNMVLNLLRHRSLAEAELLMDRSFGQYQRRQALEQRRRELENMVERLSDLERMPGMAGLRAERCSPEEVHEYFADEAELRVLRNRLRRAKRAHWQARRGRTRLVGEASVGPAGMQRMGEIRARHERSPVRRCPNLRQHRLQQQEIFALRDEVRNAREESDSVMYEYSRQLRAIVGILEEAGFLLGERPSAKGLLASRMYGENGLLMTEAIHEGWLEEFSPAELCAVLVMLAAEDRGRTAAGRRAPRFPTTPVANTYRQLRSLYYRFSELEEAYGISSLRPISRDWVQFAYDWSSGVPLTHINLDPALEFGDAIKAIKSLYSTLRQLEWALEGPGAFRQTTVSALRSLERDLIRRV